MMKNILSSVPKILALGGLVLTANLFSAFSNAQDSTDISVDPTNYLDHFMCYNVEHNAIPTDIFVRVKDQFLRQGYKVFGLVQLCAPAVKKHDNKVYEIKYGFAHLACYKVEPLDRPSADANVIINNQFQKDTPLFVRQVRTICVPTLKKHLQ